MTVDYNWALSISTDKLNPKSHNLWIGNGRTSTTQSKRYEIASDVVMANSQSYQPRINGGYKLGFEYVWRERVTENYLSTRKKPALSKIRGWYFWILEWVLFLSGPSIIPCSQFIVLFSGQVPYHEPCMAWRPTVDARWISHSHNEDLEYKNLSQTSKSFAWLLGNSTLCQKIYYTQNKFSNPHKFLLRIKITNGATVRNSDSESVYEPREGWSTELNNRTLEWISFYLVIFYLIQLNENMGKCFHTCAWFWNLSQDTVAEKHTSKGYQVKYIRP